MAGQAVQVGRVCVCACACVRGGDGEGAAAVGGCAPLPPSQTARLLSASKAAAESCRAATAGNLAMRASPPRPRPSCRYHLAHNLGTSTFNKQKLRQMCGKMGLPLPDLAAPPPPPSPELRQREEAEAAEAAAAAEQQPEAVEARQAREALLAVAATGTAAAVEAAQ